MSSSCWRLRHKKSFSVEWSWFCARALVTGGPSSPAERGDSMVLSSARPRIAQKLQRIWLLWAAARGGHATATNGLVNTSIRPTAGRAAGTPFLRDNNTSLLKLKRSSIFKTCCMEDNLSTQLNCSKGKKLNDKNLIEGYSVFIEERMARHAFPLLLFFF